MVDLGESNVIKVLLQILLDSSAVSGGAWYLYKLHYKI